MKKALKVTMGLALATSALTPVAAFASLADDHIDSVALDGLYNTVTGQFYSSADFKALDTATKKAVFKNADFIFVLAGKVYPATAVVDSTNAELKDAATPQADYEEENDILFTDDGRIIGEDGEVIDTIVKVTDVVATTDEATRTTTVTANVDNYEEGATATVTITPDAALELAAIVTEDVAIDAEGKVSLNVGELPNGTHTVTVTVGDTPVTEEFVVELSALVAVDSVAVVNATTTEVTLTNAKADATAENFKVLVGETVVTPTSVTVKAGSEDKVYTIVHASLEGTAGNVTVNDQVAAFDFTAVKVESVMAINAKTIEVTFNKAVADTSKAAVELLRGTFKQNVTLTWSTDRTSVQLVGASNFQAADYTVNVSGLTEAALSSSVKIEAQKVASLEILDEVAVVSKAAKADGTFDTGTTATVSYIVKDQYGTDITKTTTLKTNDATDTTIKADSAKGVIALSGNVVEGKKANDLVPVVLIDTNTGTSVTKTVKLSAVSTVSSIEVAGIYNAKGEEVALNDKSKATDAFIVLDLKDQYGKVITDHTKAAGLVITNTNQTNLTIANAVSKVKIGDKDQLVIAMSAILKAGNTDVLLISTTNGQSAKYTVQVAETSTTDAISVSQPEIAVAGESTLIPLTVTDKEGNVITDKKLLADLDKGIKVGGVRVTESALEVKDGQVFYKSTLAAGTQALVFQTSTFKVATITVDVKAVAKPTVVRGLKNPLVISTAQNSVTITAAKHLVIEDQYGREMKGSTAPVKVTLVGTSDVVTVGNNIVTAAKNGTATLNIALVTANGTIDSAVEVPVQVTDGTEYTGYDIAPIGKTKAGVSKDFTVNGLLNNGKVALETGEYSATITGGKITTPKVVTSSIIVVAATDLNKDTADKEIDTEFTLKVTINATGEVVEQKFTVSNEDVKVEDFFFTTAATTTSTTDYDKAKAITDAVVKGGTYKIDSAIVKDEDSSTALNIATVDQYGNKVIVAATGNVTIVPEKASDVTITGNGTVNAKAVLKADVEETKLTVKVKNGNATKELKVVLKAGTPQ